MDATMLISVLESISTLQVLLGLACGSIFVLLLIQQYNMLGKSRSAAPLQNRELLVEPILQQSRKPSTAKTSSDKSVLAADVHTRQPACVPRGLLVELQAKTRLLRTSSTYSETTTSVGRVRIATSPVEECEWDVEGPAPTWKSNIIPVPPVPPVPIFPHSIPTPERKLKITPDQLTNRVDHSLLHSKRQAEMQVALFQAIRKRRPACDLDKTEEEEAEVDEEGWDVVPTADVAKAETKQEAALIIKGWLSTPNVLTGVTIVAAVGVLCAIKSGRFSRR